MLTVQSPVAHIVLAHPECAAVLQRHRIDYCCRGHLPLEQACAMRGAPAAAVLEELEAAIAGRRGPPAEDLRLLPTAQLVARVVDTHHRYLREALPFLVPLARKVARVHGGRHPRLAELQEVVAELADSLLPHLDREEEVLFPEMLARGAGSALLREELQGMVSDHLEVARLLERVRAATGDFHLPEDACTSFSTLYRELQTLEADTLQHVHLENHVLRPRFCPEEA